MKVILFYIGDFPVRSYGLIVAISFIIAVGIAYFLAKDTKYRQHIVDMSSYILIGGILSARIWEVFFFQWEYYSKNPGEILAVWHGGLSIQGGLVGGFLAAALYVRYHKINFWELADLVAPAIIFGQGIGRIACFLNGDAFGSTTGTGFGLVYPEGTMAYSTYGSQPLWPAELFEMQWDFLVFGLLLVFKNRTWPTGFVFLAYNVLYSSGRFFLEFLRGDTPKYMFDWSAAQWTSISVILISLILMFVFYTRSKQHNIKIAH